jgi:hypothetical protein
MEGAGVDDLREVKENQEEGPGSRWKEMAAGQWDAGRSNSCPCALQRRDARQHEAGLGQRILGRHPAANAAARYRPAGRHAR